MSKRRNKDDATLDYVDDGSSDDDSDDEWLEREAVPEDEQDISLLSQEPARGSKQSVDEILDSPPRARKPKRSSKNAAAASSADGSKPPAKRRTKKNAAAAAAASSSSSSSKAPNGNNKAKQRKRAAQPAVDDEADDDAAAVALDAENRARRRLEIPHTGKDFTLNNGTPVPHTQMTLSTYRLRFLVALGGEPELVYVMHLIYFLLQCPRAFVRFYRHATKAADEFGTPQTPQSFVDWLLTRQYHNRFYFSYEGRALYVHERVDDTLYGNRASDALVQALGLLRPVADGVLQTHELFEGEMSEEAEIGIIEAMLTFALCGLGVDRQPNHPLPKKDYSTHWSLDFAERRPSFAATRGGGGDMLMNTHAWLLSYMEFLRTNGLDSGDNLHPLRLIAFFDDLFLRQSRLAEARPKLDLRPLVVRRQGDRAHPIANLDALRTTHDADLQINPERIERLLNRLPTFGRAVGDAAGSPDAWQIAQRVRDDRTTPEPLRGLLTLLLGPLPMFPCAELMPCHDFNRLLVDQGVTTGKDARNGVIKKVPLQRVFDAPAPSADNAPPARLTDLVRRMNAVRMERRSAVVARGGGAINANNAAAAALPPSPPLQPPPPSALAQGENNADAIAVVRRAFQTDSFLLNALMALRLVYLYSNDADAENVADRNPESVAIRIRYRDAVAVYLRNHALAVGLAQAQLEQAIETFLRPGKEGYHYLQELRDALMAFSDGSAAAKALVDEQALRAADAELYAQILQLHEQERAGDATAVETLQYCRAAHAMLRQLYELLPDLRFFVTRARLHDNDARSTRLRNLREIYEKLGNTVIGTPFALWHTSPLYNHSQNALLECFRSIVHNMHLYVSHATFDVLAQALAYENNGGDAVIDEGNAYEPIDQQAAHAAEQAVSAPAAVAADSQHALGVASSATIPHQAALDPSDDDAAPMSFSQLLAELDSPSPGTIVGGSPAAAAAGAGGSSSPPPPQPLDMSQLSQGALDFLLFTPPDQGAFNAEGLAAPDIDPVFADNPAANNEDNANNDADIFGVWSQPIEGHLSAVGRKRVEGLDDVLATIESNPSSVAPIAALFRRLPLMRYLHATLTSSATPRQLDTPVVCALYYVLLQRALHWAVPAVGIRVSQQRRLGAPFLLSYYVNEHTLRYDIYERALELPVVCTQQPARHTLFWHEDSQSGVVQLAHPSRTLRTLEFITTDSHQSFSLQPQDDDGLLYAFDSKHTASSDSGDGPASLTIELTRTARNTLSLVGVTQARDAVDPLVPWQVLVARRQRRARRGWPQWVELLRSDAKAMPLGLDIATPRRDTTATQQLDATAVRELSRRGIAQVHYHGADGAQTSVRSTGAMDVARTLHVYEPSALERANSAPWAISIEPPLSVADLEDALLLDVGGQSVLHVLALANTQQSLAMPVPLRRRAGATLVPAIVFGQ